MWGTRMKTFAKSALIGVMALGLSTGLSMAGNAPSSPVNPAIAGQQVALLHHYCAICQYVPTGRKFCFNVVGITEIDARTLAAAKCTLTTVNPFYKKVHRGSCSTVRACR
jgi:hypothetical protein